MPRGSAPWIKKAELTQAKAKILELCNYSMFYVYVLQNTEVKLYFGSTNDLKSRLKEHQTGKSFATKGNDWTLIY